LSIFKSVVGRISVADVPSPGIIERMMPVNICGKSDAVRRAEQGGLEEPADELRLTAGSGFRENALCVRTCCRLGNFKLRRVMNKARSVAPREPVAIL
jgi:hypothetical protein